MCCFEQKGKILEVGVDERISWMPEKIYQQRTMEVEDLEFLPPLVAAKRWKPGKTSQADLKEIRLRNPDLDKEIRENESLQVEAITLGDHLIHRDVKRDLGEDSASGVLLPPLVHVDVVHNIVNGEEEEIRTEAVAIFEAHFKRHGLVGVPIQAGGRWTLLVFARSGG